MQLGPPLPLDKKGRVSKKIKTITLTAHNKDDQRLLAAIANCLIHNGKIAVEPAIGERIAVEYKE